MSRLLPDGSWGIPINLGPAVNTKYNEALPTVSYRNGMQIFFSSDRPESMGGYDIFYTQYDPKTKKLVKPVNYGYPINDLYDNLSISFTQNPRYAYISKLKKDGYGDMDIYKVVYNKIPKPITIYTGKVLEGNYYQNKPVTNPENVTISVIDLKTNQELSSQFRISKITKRYTITLKPGHYQINFTYPKHEKFTKEVNVYDEQLPSYIIKQDIILIPITNKKY